MRNRRRGQLLAHAAGNVDGTEILRGRQHNGKFFTAIARHQNTGALHAIGEQSN